MSTGVSNLVHLSFAWQGQTVFRECDCNLDRVSAIGLTFAGSPVQISVNLPLYTNTKTPESFYFKCVVPSKTEGKDGHFNSAQTHVALSVSSERMRTLKVTAYFKEHFVSSFDVSATDTNPQQLFLKPVEEGCREWSENVSLEIPQDLVVGKLYQLIVSSNGSLLSARLAEPASRPSENKDNA